FRHLLSVCSLKVGVLALYGTEHKTPRHMRANAKLLNRGEMFFTHFLGQTLATLWPKVESGNRYMSTGGCRKIIVENKLRAEPDPIPDMRQGLLEMLDKHDRFLYWSHGRIRQKHGIGIPFREALVRIPFVFRHGLHILH